MLEEPYNATLRTLSSKFHQHSLQQFLALFRVLKELFTNIQRKRLEQTLISRKIIQIARVDLLP